MPRTLACALLFAVLTAPVAAKDSLGVYSNWAAFRDADTPRCYAIAKPRNAKKQGAYASLGTWPRRNIRNQFHIRLSRPARDDASARLRIGSQTFQLATKGLDAWAQNPRMDAAIAAAVRSAARMSLSVQSSTGARFTDRYNLKGAATAIDASIVGCANR